MNYRDKRDKRDIAGHSAAETLQLAATSATLRDMILVYGYPGAAVVADVADTCKVAKRCLTRHVALVADVASKVRGVRLEVASIGSSVTRERREQVTTHYRRGSTAACTARVRPPWLTGETADVDCGNCERTHAYRNMAGLPPVSLPVPAIGDLPADAAAHPADVPMLTEWLKRAS